jgi:1-acyl-sn-glycerol-3-phosphate acyltransferase
VSNHQSFTDTAIISMLPWEMKWLAKSSLFWIPFIGWAMWLAGDIKVHRGNRDSAKDAMKQCKEWLTRGANVMIFPEGTRSKTGVMGEFKEGAFRLAIETKSTAIVPVCCTPSLFLFR